MIKKFFAVLLVISLSVPLAAKAATEQDVRNFTDNIAKQALDIIKNVPDKVQKQTQLEQLFSGHVDIPWIGRFVLGRYWRQAQPEQQARYLNKYRDFIISHYTSHLTDYSSGGYRIIAVRQAADDDFTVSMKIDPPEREPISVDYRLHMAEGSLKIYDIIIEGVSLITTQRSEFTSVMQNKGIDALTDQLHGKTVAVR